MPAKILIIAGPNRGATYFLSEGENTIGRDESCNIVLSSEKVSKRHCELNSSNGGRSLDLTDLGSSNGTFVNGVLAKKKNLKNNDKVSIGPFIFQVFLQSAPKVKMAVPNFSTATPASAPAYTSAAIEDVSISTPPVEEPTSLFGRLKKRFDEIVLPVMYGFYEKHDFPSIFISMFVAFMVLSVGFSVSPILEQTHEEVFREAKARAIYIAKQMALLNRQALMEGKESQLNVDFAEGDLNVREHVLINLDMRIMAPATHMNEMFNNTTVLRFKDNLLKEPKNWEIPYTVKVSPDGEKITVMVPVMVLSKEKGINVPGAIAVVVFSTSHLSLDSGTEAAIYFETFFTMAMLGSIFLYLLYQLTFQPIRMLNDDIDRVLKGEAESVEKRYRSEMINSLIDTVNSALSRISKASSSSDTGMSLGEQEQIVTDNFMRHLEQTAAKLSAPVMILDAEERIKYINAAFEELTGIRGAVGELIESVSRDESFPSLVREMMGKSKDAGNDGITEDYDFNSGLHKINCVALISVPGKAEGFMFHFEKAEG